MIVSTALLLVTMVAIVVTTFLCPCCKLSEKISKKVANVKSMIFFSSPIRYTMANSLKLNLSSLLALKVVNDSSWSQTLVASLILVVINCMPFLYARLIWKKYDVLDEDLTKQRYGNLYSKRNTNKAWKKRLSMSPFSYFYRRAAFMCVTVFLFDYPALQMICFQVITIASIVLLVKDTSIFKHDKARFTIEVVTESLLLTISLFMQA